MDLNQLHNQISNCRKCDLWETRTNIVPGDGDNNADIFLIGEAPGRNEDLQGKPFVGRAGKILDEMLKSISLKREDIFIGNIVKCRPPKNRNPSNSEIKACTPYLDKQIELINPKIIVPMGSFAANYILEKYGLKKDKISNIHGKKFEVRTLSKKIFIMPVFHPAVATYDRKKISIMIEDFKKIKEYL